VTFELHRASEYAISEYDSIQKANKEAEDKGDKSKSGAHGPRSEEEKAVMERMRKVVVLYMALCIRKIDMIDLLLRLSCAPKADVLARAVRGSMAKLARAAASRHGAASIAMDVAAMTGSTEVPMLLSFLENLSPSPESDLIEACFMIQTSKSVNGVKDPRYIIPIVSAMKRHVLVERLPEFIIAEDNVFLAALERMNDKVGRQALLFREEPDEINPSLLGMTLCEQLVFLHKLDFAAVSIPQKQYLAAIKLCLESDETYNDRIWMSALDYMSGIFLTGVDRLPLAFMRTCILVCSKHESLHSWIAHVLLLRLVEGKIYEDARQWEGFQRCAHMLEKSGEAGVNVFEAINKLPPEQLMQYKTKWAGK
jgi:symplekin